jgi:hypothetical protein
MYIFGPSTLRLREQQRLSAPHHYRAQNKMVDKAASIAIDARRSIQDLARDAPDELTAFNPLLANGL